MISKPAQRPIRVVGPGLGHAVAVGGARRLAIRPIVDGVGRIGRADDPEILGSRDETGRTICDQLRAAAVVRLLECDPRRF